MSSMNYCVVECCRKGDDSVHISILVAMADAASGD